MVARAATKASQIEGILSLSSRPLFCPGQAARYSAPAFATDGFRIDDWDAP